MDHYDIWCDLAPGANDLEFVEAVRTYLGHLQVPRYSISRRKLGFGPPGLGEFHIRISFPDLAALDEAFNVAATRNTIVEPLHHAVYSRIMNFKSGLYRDFPDPHRLGASATDSREKTS
ncbi:MAG TPA: DUF6614 family protein [Fimbriimonadaceae bacterium]|nr:DUF6614 family protein [Fimbriimonadaceae bacterium]